MFTLSDYLHIRTLSSCIYIYTEQCNLFMSVTAFIYYKLPLDCCSVGYPLKIHLKLKSFACNSLLCCQIIFVKSFWQQKWVLWTNQISCDLSLRCFFPGGISCIATTYRKSPICQKQVSRAGTSNYFPQYPWDVITCPCPWYLFLAQHSSIVPTAWFHMRYVCMKVVTSELNHHHIPSLWIFHWDVHWQRCLLMAYVEVDLSHTVNTKGSRSLFTHVYTIFLYMICY